MDHVAYPTDISKQVTFEIVNFGIEGNTVLMSLDLGADGVHPAVLSQ